MRASALSSHLPSPRGVYLVAASVALMGLACIARLLREGGAGFDVAGVIL